MSWTNVFPVLTEEMVSEYKETVTPVEKAELHEWLGVKKRLNLKPSPHLVSVSVFWKNLRQEEPDLPPLTRELLMNAPALGIVRRHAPWEHYIGNGKGNLTRAGCWFKIQAMLRAMREHRCRWFYWIDADAIFSNWSVELRQYAIGHFDMVCPTWEDVPGPRPSTGTILLQSTATTRRIPAVVFTIGPCRANARRSKSGSTA